MTTRLHPTRLALGALGLALSLGLARVAVALLGDVTGDGAVNNTDAQHVQDAVVGTRTLTPAQLADADVDGDGDIDVSDAQQIRQFAAGLLTGFPVRTPQQSGPIALTRDGDLLGVVNPDSNTATFVATDGEAVLAEVAIGREPTGIAFARDGGRALVTVGRDAEVVVVDTATLAVTNRIPVGVEPFGVVVNFRGDRAYVSNLASGTVSVIDVATETVIDEIPVAPKPEGLAVSADSSRVFVTHLFGGQVSVINTATHTVASIPLAVIPFDADNPTQPAGKPNRMKGIAIHPLRNEAWLPHILSNSDNVVETLFNTTIFPAVGVLDTAAPAELANARMTLFAGLATVVSNPEAVAFTPDGDLGLVVSAASNDLTILDATTRQQVGLVRDVGDNPRGIAIHPDGTLAYVFNRLTPSVSVVDVAARTLVRQIAVSHDPLPPNIANGRRLVFTSAPPEVAQDRFFGCEACHFDGRDDGQTWFFTNGPRQTLSLAGTTANTGLLHHNGDRKNVQDFAFTFTRLQNGTGVTPDQLDDLADFVDTSIRFLENPNVNPDLSRTAAARRGRRLFRGAADCARCHTGPFLTDATGHTDPAAPLLHDVGIFAEGVLTQDEFDKTRDQEGIAEGTVRPAGSFESTFLLGVFSTAPYLHDGRAATLRDTLTVHNVGDRHGTTGALTPAQLDDLVAYLEQVDITQARVEITFPADGARVAGLTEVSGNVLPDVEAVDVFVNGGGPIAATVAAGSFHAVLLPGSVPALPQGTRFDLTALATTTSGEPGRDDIEVEANFSGGGTVNLGRSTVEADPLLIPSDGVATSLVTITPRDGADRPVGSGLAIDATATAGTLGPVLDVGDGRYVALLTAATSPGSAVVSARHAGGTAFADTAQVFFAAGTVDGAMSQVSVAPGSIDASVAARAIVTVVPRDALGNDLGPTQTVAVAADRGTVAAAVDNGDGTYTAAFTPPTTPGTARFTATVNGVVLTTRPAIAIVADVTAPAAPDLSRVTFATPAGGASRATGGVGTVEASATVRLQNLTTGAPVVNTSAAADGSFSANVPVATNQVVCLRAVDAAGNTSAASCTIPFPLTVPTVRGVLRTARAGGGFNPVAGAVVQLEIANLTDPLAPAFTPFFPPLTATTGADGAFAIVLPAGFVPDPNLAVTGPDDVFGLVNDVERTVLVDQLSSLIVFMIGFNDLLLDLPAPFPATNFTPEERAAIEDALRPATTEINFFGLSLEDALQAVADDVFFDTARDFLDLTAFAVFKAAAESPGGGGTPTIVRGRLTVPSGTGPRPLAGVRVDLASFGFTGCGFPICVTPIAGANGVTNAAGEYSLALPGFIAPGSSTAVVAIGDTTYGAFGLPGAWNPGVGVFSVGGFVTDPAANADVDLAGRVAMSLLGNEGVPLVNYNPSEMNELVTLLRTKIAALSLNLAAGRTLQQVFVQAFNAMAGDSGVTALVDAIKDAETGDNSNVTASPTTLEADGVSVSTITVEPLSPTGERVGPGLLVQLATTVGTITTPAIDNHDGTYTGFLRAPTTPGSATVVARVEGTVLSEQPTVTFTADVTAPAPPNAGRVIFVGGGATTATLIGLPGTAEAGSLVTIVNTTRGTTVTVRAGDDGSFRADIFGSVGDDLDVHVADAAGNLSGTTDLDVAGGLPLPAIVNPTAVPAGVTPTLAPLAAAELGIAVPTGFGFVGGFTLGLGDKAATTALDVVAAASAPVPPGKALLLAQVITARGEAELRVVAPALAAGGVLFQRLGAAFPGVLTGGRYAFLAADAPQSFLVGTVDGSRGAIEGVHMTLEGSPFTDLTRPDGRFVVPGPLGAARTLGAALLPHQQPEQMTARLPFAGAEVDCDFTLITRATVSFAFSGRFTTVGQVSRRMALTPAGTKLYVAETLRGDLSILDTTSLAEISLVDDGSTLLDLAFTSNGFEAFLAYAGRVRDFTTSIEEPGRIISTVGFPRRVAITPNGDLALVASSLDNALGDTTPDAVFPIDTFTNVVAAPIPVPADPAAIAVNRAGTRAYVVSAQGQVTVIDVGARSVVRTVALGGALADVAVKGDGTEVYVADGTANAVKVLAAAALEDATPGNEVLATIGVGAGPTSVALVPGGAKLLVSESTDDTVSVIDLATRTVGPVWATVDQPAQVVAHPSGKTAYVLDPQLQRGVLETTVAASDTTTPAVVDVGAQDRTGFLLQDSPLEVVFSERMDPTTVTLANLQVRDAANAPVPGTLAPTGDGVAAVFTPLAGVRYALTSTLRVVFTTALHDAAGLSLPAGERAVPTVPMQVPDLNKIEVDLTTGGIEATGTAGAVEPTSAIDITNLRTGQIFRTTAAANGSFHVVLAGLDTDGFRLVTSLFGGRARTEPITLPVNFTIVIPDPAKVSYVPGPAGTLLAVGAAGAVDPQASRVRLRNRTSGQNFDTTTAGADGSFSIGIFAERTDTLDLVVTILGALTLDPVSLPSPNLPAPVIDFLTPERFVFGTPVSLTVVGRNLGAVAGNIRLTVGGAVRTDFSLDTVDGSPDQQAVLVALPVGADSGVVQVTVAGQASNTAAFFAETPPNTSPFAEDVIDASVAGDPNSALGENDAQFTDLGPGGSLTLRLGSTVEDGPGSDLQVFEDTADGADCYQVLVSASEVGPFDSLGQVCGTAFADLAGHDPIRFVRLVDAADGGNAARIGGVFAVRVKLAVEIMIQDAPGAPLRAIGGSPLGPGPKAVTATLSSGDKQICVKGTAAFSVNVTPPPQGGGGYGGGCSDSISWSAGGGGSVSPTSGTGTTFTAGDTGAQSTIVVTVTRQGNCSTAGSDSKSVKVDAVEVESLIPAEGKELDDGDGDASTKTYVLAKATTGTVTVTAKPKPALPEAKLPACWSLMGGTGSGKLDRTVDKTMTATTTLVAKAGPSMKTTKVVVLMAQFVQDPAQKYGFDSYVPVAGGNLDRADRDVPQKSVKNGDSDTAMCNIMPAADADKTFFKSTSTGNVTVAPMRATMSPETVTLTGASTGSSEIQANAGAEDGQTAGKLGATSYNELSKTVALILVHEDNDDVQAIPVLQGKPNAAAITPGSNGTLDSAPVGDDTVVGGTITTGPNGITESTKSGDDVQAIALGNGEANVDCVTQGTNGEKDTPLAGDDVHSFLGLGDDILTGPNGLCESLAVSTDVMSTDMADAAFTAYLNNTIYNQAVVKWTVTRLPAKQVNFDLNFDGMIDVTPCFGSESNKVISEAGDSGYDHNIFLVDNPDDGSFGCAEFNQRYVFVHGGQHTGAAQTDVNTGAHELGHAQGLLHPNSNGDPDAANLMHATNTNPVLLRKQQWDHLNP